MFIVEKLQNYPWLQKLNGGDFEKVLRKLPNDMKKALIAQDIVDIQKILKQLNLESKVPVTRLVTIIQIILSSTTRANDFGKQYNNAVKTLVDLLVDNLFDNK